MVYHTLAAQLTPAVVDQSAAQGAAVETAGQLVRIAHEDAAPESRGVAGAPGGVQSQPTGEVEKLAGEIAGLAGGHGMQAPLTAEAEVKALLRRQLPGAEG